MAYYTDTFLQYSSISGAERWWAYRHFLEGSKMAMSNITMYSSSYVSSTLWLQSEKYTFRNTSKGG